MGAAPRRSRRREGKEGWGAEPHRHRAGCRASRDALELAGGGAGRSVRSERRRGAGMLRTVRGEGRGKETAGLEEELS